MNNRITIKDIAADVGVSVSTVSYVLNDNKKFTISEQTRQKVLDAAERLGYVQNKNAAILRRGKSNTIGVVSYWDDSFVYSSFIKGIKETSAKKGYKIIIYSAANTVDINDCIGYYRDNMLDAVIVIAPYGDNCKASVEDIVDRLCEMQVKYSVIGETADNSDHSFIINYFESTYVATKYFISKGITDITYVSPPIDVNERIERLDGYNRAMAENGLEMRFCEVADVEKQIDNFRAVVTNKSKTAHQILTCAAKKGIRVPDDFELIAGNTEYYSEYLYPPVTSVVIPAEELGALAAQDVLNQIDGLDNVDAKKPEYKIRFMQSTR